MIENRNTILAVILSGLVLIAWQYFLQHSHHGKAARRAAARTGAKASGRPGRADAGWSLGHADTRRSAVATPVPGAPGTAAPVQSRAAAIAAGPRVKIDTPSISGSIALTGGRIDDVALVKYRETVDPKSPAIELFSPSAPRSRSTPSSASCRPQARPQKCRTRTPSGNRKAPMR